MKRGIILFVRALILLAGALVCFNAVMLFLLSNFNLGNILTLLLGGILLLYGIYFQKVNRDFPKALKIVLAAGMAVLILFAGFLLTFGSVDTANYKEDAIIVLGAAVHGETPSAVLKTRLDSALRYHKKNPDALIVVSGGKGAQEDITEAEAMKRYLVARGVDPNIIIKEENATSTLENFRFSKAILDKLFGGQYRVCFISNEFHIYRASGFAKAAGFANTTHLHSNTRFDSILPGTLRECLAVLYFWVF